MNICVLGRQPAIGIAELESLYSAKSVKLIANNVALVDLQTDQINFERLGSTVKLCRVINTFETDSWQSASRQAVKQLNKNLPLLPVLKKKVTLGFSAYGFDVSAREVQKIGIIIKNKLKSAGINVRLVPNNEVQLSSAQVLHNKLYTPFKSEMVLVKSREGITYLCETVAVQDINAYTFRDRSRPKRDTFVGMLPPKLAQTIINLAVGELNENEKTQKTTTIFDPFCGTGVVLTEAVLMGYAVYGSDLSHKMVDYSETNVKWIAEKYRLANVSSKIVQADANSHKWELFINPNKANKIVIAGEGYLGQPLGGQSVGREKIAKIIDECNQIMQGFLKNVATQLPNDSRLCIAMPVWFVGSDVFHLPTVNSLPMLGFSRVEFEHAKQSDLIYHREDQQVGRELVVLRKI